MVFPAFLFVTLVVCMNSVMGHHLREKVYQKMCGDDGSFGEELVQCLSQMPKKDQLIFQLCGSALENDLIDDYNKIINDMCGNETHASKVVDCIDHISHMFYHFNDSHCDKDHSQHKHGDHDHDHDHDDHDHDHDDHDHDHDHHDHDHDHDHGHHDHQFDFGHGVYNEECFQRLYKAFNITTSKEDEA